MALTKVDRSVLEREPKRRTERAEYCDNILDEFVGKKLGCAEITDYQEQGTLIQVSGCLRTRIGKREGCNVKVATRKGRIYLYEAD